MQRTQHPLALQFSTLGKGIHRYPYPDISPALVLATVALSLALPAAGVQPAGQSFCTSASGTLERELFANIAPPDSLAFNNWTRALAFGDSLIAVSPLEGGGLAVFSAGSELLWSIRDTAISTDWNVMLDRLGDTVVVFDPGKHQRRHYSIQGKLIRSIPVPYATTYRLGMNDDVFLTMNFRTPELIGYPLHILRAGADNPTDFVSLGYPKEAAVTAGNVWDYEWKLATGERSAMWTHYRDRFYIEEWKDSQRTGRFISANPPWLPPNPWDLGLGWATPALHAVHAAADNSLWIIAQTTDANWREAVSQLTRTEELPISLKARVRDSVVEIWIPDTQVCKFRARWDDVFTGFAADGLLYLPRVRGDRVELELWTVFPSIRT